MVSNAMDKAEFIEFLIKNNVLKFGDFTLKSGRQSPYFFNLGSIASGAAFAALGRAYAEAIVQCEVEFDLLFGPAYKGIPIAVATSLALADHGIDAGVAYNRKEAKAHGEGGNLVGAPVQGRVLMLDDVLTSGKAIREAAALINVEEANIVGVVIAMDRAEVTNPDSVDAPETAVSGLAKELGAPVFSIAHVRDVLSYLARQGEGQKSFEAMSAYAEQHCIL
jgi:orotate phosphoribosyltransferase